MVGSSKKKRVVVRPWGCGQRGKNKGGSFAAIVCSWRPVRRLGKPQKPHKRLQVERGKRMRRHNRSKESLEESGKTRRDWGVEGEAEAGASSGLWEKRICLRSDGGVGFLAFKSGGKWNPTGGKPSHRGEKEKKERLGIHPGTVGV